MVDSEAQLSSPYAPVRYNDVAWWHLAKVAASHGWITQSGQIEASLPDKILHGLTVPMIRATQGTDAGGTGFATAMSYRHWVPLAGQFIACGRQIFDLGDGLVESLRNTDIREATLEGLHVPFDSFYVRLGAQADLRLEYPDGSTRFELLDGFFVAMPQWSDPDDGLRRLMIGLTTVRDDSGHGFMAPGYFLDFAPEHLKLPCLEAIEAALDRRRSLVRVEGFNESHTAAHIGLYEEVAKLLRPAMQLIINALFYLEHVEAQKLHQEPGRDAPTTLVARWAQAEPARRNKLRQKLNEDGYVLVRLVGREYGRATGKTHGTVAPHWRRGHWRMQAHGTGRALRKRVHIAAQFINPSGDPADVIQGHIYVPGSDSRQ